MQSEEVRAARVQKHCGDVSRTHQSFKDECDINVVMRRYANNGQFPNTNPMQPTYGDFTNSTDYLQARLQVGEAMDEFMQLPSAVRAACDNDPAKFLDMCADPERLEELQDLGLAERSVPPVLDPVAPETPVAPTEPALEGGE